MWEERQNERYGNRSVFPTQDTEAETGLLAPNFVPFIQERGLPLTSVDQLYRG